MPDFLAEFIGAMHDRGLAPAEKIIADDKIRRYKIIDQKKRNGSYKLRIDSNFAVGWFRSHGEGFTHKWHSASKEKMSQADRIATKERIQAEKEKNNAAAIEAQFNAQRKAKSLWTRSAMTGDSVYLRRKGVKNHSARLMGGYVVVPMYESKALVNVQKISADGSKTFLLGGKVNGCYCPIGEAPQGSIVVCEGFATGATIHECTGLPVAVAFAASNLLHVATKIRKKYKEIDIIFAADNDQWSKRANGEPYNAGLSCANKAADAVGGRVIFPVVDSEHPARPTDWNDIFLEGGKERIRNAFEIPKLPSAKLPKLPKQLQPRPTEAPESKMPFRVLGYNAKDYYYFPKEGRQLISLSPTGHNIQNLRLLAPLQYWEDNFGGKDTSHSKIALFAMDCLMSAAHRAGVFSPDEKLRGVGAWLDEGRNVLHCGGTLYVDGEVVNPYNFDSNYIYQAGHSILNFDAPMLPSSQAVKLKEICEMLKWENPLSASLLAGWCVVAPVCAMLPWRPHVWITGESGSGKSTVMNKIIKPVLAEMAIHESGGTTEAGIRQRMKHDGRPVVYDEGEAEDRFDDIRMSGVLMLARKSSSGATISKGSQNGEGVQYQVRSCFCFGSINVSIKKRADESRVSILGLKKSKDEAHYDLLTRTINATLTPDFARGLLRRTVTHLDVLVQNIATFTDAAAIVLGDRRPAEQIGAMLAGVHMLHSTKPISIDDAKIWVNQHNWDSYTAIGDNTDQERLLTHLCMYPVRADDGQKTIECNIGILIACAMGKDTRINPKKADEHLRAIGICWKRGHVVISNTSPRVAKMLDGTQWASKWARILCDLPGTKRVENTFFTPGHKSRAVSIPAGYFVDTGDEDGESEVYE